MGKLYDKRNNTNAEHTKRYNKMEDRILYAINTLLKTPNGEGYLTLQSIATMAGCSRWTLHTHFRSVNTIFSENIEKMLVLATDVAEQSRQKEMTTTNFIFQLMLMICRNSIHFKIELNRDSYRFWKRFLPEVKDILTQDWQSQGATYDQAIFRAYCTEFVGIMTAWGEDGFMSDRIEFYLTRLKYLTENASQRELKLVG